MNVHMVTHWVDKRSHRQPWPRLVRYLQDGLGWTASHKADPEMDVNYILTYSVGWRRYADPWRLYEELGTPLVCRIGERPPYGIKARLWDQATEIVNLRLTESKQYLGMLAQYGDAAKVELFPVERDLFTISRRAPNERPTIGVVGYTVPNGRKGSVLVNELAHYPGARQWRVKGAGRGWPVKTTEYKYHDLGRFYNSLDVHLCPTVSGDSPTSPFEALACGVPLVIPRGVGLLDELPDTHGIYRYEMGDFDDMVATLRRCIDERGTHDREALRALTENMTVEKLCEDHRQAFQNAFGEETKMETMPEWAAS